MRYVMARYVEYQHEMAYRVFITDALYKDAENRFIPARMRFYDVIHPPKKVSGDEIALEVINKAGLVVKQ